MNQENTIRPDDEFHAIMKEMERRAIVPKIHRELCILKQWGLLPVYHFFLEHWLKSKRRKKNTDL